MAMSLESIDEKLYRSIEGKILKDKMGTFSHRVWHVAHWLKWS
jgi:hypothetical protein